jgi:DNA-binding transcriptional MerR regulator
MTMITVMMTTNKISSSMIPNKSNFKFQELTPITGVKPYVIRFWETEFDDIAPMISDSGQKLYARKDVEAILKIKKLLFDEKLTIPEARLAIKSHDLDLTGSTEAQKVARNLSDKSIVKAELLTSLQYIRDIRNKHNW